jgi:hypothetical protein
MSSNQKLFMNKNETSNADCSPAPCSVESVNRQVIENQLLTSLCDKSKVAILATEDDLRMLINALKTHSMCYPGWAKKNSEYVADLEQLKSAAFPPNAPHEPCGAKK